MKRLLTIAAFISLLAVTVLTQSSGTPSTLRVRVDSTGALVLTAAGAQTPPYTTTIFGNTRLKTDSNNNLVVAGSFGGNPGGADTQVQYNNAGAFAGDAGLTYNAATDTLSAGIYRIGAVNAVRAQTALDNWWFANSGNATATGIDNFGFGTDALLALTTGEKNIAIGEDAGESITVATGNVLIGYRANQFGTGADEICIGQDACRGVGGHGGNVFIGAQSGEQITGGTGNVGIGKFSLGNILNSSQNTAVGRATLFDLVVNSGAGDNTALGYNTGRGITTGVQNTIIGANVGGLASGLTGNIILATGAGTIRAQHAGTFWQLNSYGPVTLATSLTAPSAPVACTSPTVTWSNGTASAQFDVGTSCTGVSTLAITLPAATNGWLCDGINLTTNTVYVTQTGAGTTTSVTLTNYARTTGLAADFVDGADIRIKCIGG